MGQNQKPEPADISRLATSPRKTPRLVTLSEVAAVLGCSLKTVRRRIAAGELPVVRDGRLVRVLAADLDLFIAARRSL